MLRLLPITVWTAGFMWCALTVTSDYIFADRPVKPWIQGVGLALVWPIAILSTPGRELLLNAWRKL